MKIIYVLKSAVLGGGTKVVLEHIHRLIKRNHDVELYYLTDPPTWFSHLIPARQFKSAFELISELRKHQCIKIATWYETAYWVQAGSVPSDLSCYLIQDIEESYCTTQAQKDFALNTYKLGLKPIVEGVWVKQQLQSRFSLTADNVSIGIDFDTFKPLNNMRDPYRILTQCRPCISNNLKDWPTAKAVIERCHRDSGQVTCITFSTEPKQQLTPSLVHMHMQGVSDTVLNETYNTSGVYLLSSKHEGFGLTAAEAQATLTPLVTTNANGNMEFCEHGKTALVAPVGDVSMLTTHIQSLMANKDYAIELANNAHKCISRYTWDRTVDRLEQSLSGKQVTYSPPEPVTVKPVLVTAGPLEYPRIQQLREPSKQLVTVIVPTVNDFDKTDTCVKSIKDSRYSDIEVIIADDGTQNETIRCELAALAIGNSGRCKFTNMEQNLGYSANVNNALKSINGEYVLLCNNDVKLDPNCIFELVTVANSDPKIGIVGAKLLYPDQTIQHAGVHKQPNSLTFLHSYKDLPATTITPAGDVWAVTGAVMLIKRSVLTKIGGLSVGYTTSCEDLDYCLNAWLNGYRVVFTNTALATHTEGATRGRTIFKGNLVFDLHSNNTIWAMREEASIRYFCAKWSAISTVNTLDELKGLQYANNESDSICDRGIRAA